MHQGISFSICRIHLLVLVTRSEWRYRAENFFKRQILTRFFIVVYAKWANFQLCLYHGKNKLYSLKWRLCTRPPRLVGYYSASSLKQQSAGIHVTQYFVHILTGVPWCILQASTLTHFLTCPFGQLTKKSTCPTQSVGCPKKLIKITKTRE
jgi:hypothetical protein